MRDTRGTAEEGFPILPYEDVVYVEQIIEEASKGGILLVPTTQAAKLQGGRVAAVGPGRYYAAAMNASQTMEAAVFVPTRTKVGDYVVFGRYQSGGEPLEINGKVYLACREGDLGGVSRDGKPVDVRLYKPD